MNRERPEKVIIEPTYQNENGVWVRELDPSQVEVEGVVMREVSLVHIPAGEMGGNHAHPRVEAFACLSGELQLSWLEGEEKREEEMEKAEGNLAVYVIPSGVAHAVKNVGGTAGFLLEYASDKQHDVKVKEVL